MPDQVTKPLTVALRLLRGDAPSQVTDAPQVWPRWAVLLPHVLAVTGHADREAVLPEPDVMTDVSGLLDQAGTYLQVQARFTEAKALLERALAIDEALYGPFHLGVDRVRRSTRSQAHDEGREDG